MPAPGRGTRRRIARSVRERNPLRSLKEMLRQLAKDQVSLMIPRRDQKSHQALSRGYKSRQALKVDLHVADRHDLEQMLCCGKKRPMLKSRKPRKMSLKDLKSCLGMIHSIRAYKGSGLGISKRNSQH
jgi:hypothetical protein